MALKTKMIDSNRPHLLDSSVWLEYFHNQTYKEVIDSSRLIIISSLSLFEIKRKMLKDKEDLDDIKSALEFIKKRSLIVVFDEEVAELAAEISLTKNLPAADSIIYATARKNNSLLVTMDNDFRGLEEVKILEHSK